MRRFVLTITTLTLFGSTLIGSSFAQDAFRFASEPFESGEVAAPSDEVESEPARDSEASGSATLESYESWPSAAKSPRFQRAAERARQRDLRIAARKWYGLSASRPEIHGNPHYSYTSGVNSWVPVNWYSQTLPWYYPRQSYSAIRATRWIAVPAESFNSAMVIR